MMLVLKVEQDLVTEDSKAWEECILNTAHRRKEWHIRAGK